MRKNVRIDPFGLVFDHVGHVAHFADTGEVVLGKRHDVGPFGGIVVDVGLCNTHILEGLRVDHRTVRPDEINILFVRDAALWLAVHEYVRMDHLKRVAGQRYCAFDVVLPFVHRPGDDFMLLQQCFASAVGSVPELVLAQDIVVVCSRIVEYDRIPFREVEYHGIVALDVAESLEPVVRPADPLDE